jgi:hypothetical protein
MTVVVPIAMIAIQIQIQILKNFQANQERAGEMIEARPVLHCFEAKWASFAQWSVLLLFFLLFFFQTSFFSGKNKQKNNTGIF